MSNEKSLNTLNQSIDAAVDAFCESIQRAYSKRASEVLFGRLEHGSDLGGLYPTSDGELAFVVDDFGGDLLDQEDMQGDTRLVMPLELLVRELQERISLHGSSEGSEDYAKLAARMRATADALENLIRDHQPK